MCMFHPIGYVHTERKEKLDHNWGDLTSNIIINPELSAGLKGLEEFSHILVIYHLHEAMFVQDKHLQRRPQGRNDMPTVGIFSQRAKDRPNPIGVTAIKLISIERNIIQVQGLDAIDGTPVLDIKPYYPQYDSKPTATVPEWVNVLMKDYF